MKLTSRFKNAANGFNDQKNQFYIDFWNDYRVQYLNNQFIIDVLKQLQ